MKTTTQMVMAEAMSTDGSYYMSRGRGGSVLVSREYAWADVKAWQTNARIASIKVTANGETVWTWER